MAQSSRESSDARNSKSFSLYSFSNVDIHKKSISQDEIFHSCCSILSNCNEYEQQDLKMINNSLEPESKHIKRKLTLAETIQSISPAYGFNKRFLSQKEKSAMFWDSAFDQMLFACGLVVGSGNLFRFPLYLLKYGTVNFLSVYIPLCVVFIYPLIFLEAGLGQFCSHGPGGCWEFARLFKGVGYLTIILSLVNVDYFMALNLLYSLIQYLFIHGYPWDSENRQIYRDIIFWHHLDLEKFYKNDIFSQNLTANLTNRNFFQDEITTKYLTTENIHEHDHDHYIFGWEIYVSYTINWVIIIMLLLPDIQSRGKIVSKIFLIVALSLCLICVRSLALPGAIKGIEFGIFNSNGTTLLDIELLNSAITHCYFSLGAIPGYHMTLASYNHFNNVISSDVLFLILVDVFFSGVGSLILFSFLGHLSQKTSFELEDIKNTPPSVEDMAIVHLPRSMSYMEEGGAGWIFFFFTTFNILLHVNTTTAFETIITGAIDIFHFQKTNRKYVVLTICFIMFIETAWIVTDYHSTISEVTRYYIDQKLTPLVGLCLVVALLYSLGVDRFISMLECSVGWYTTPIMSNLWWKLWWKISWKYTVPLTLIAIFAASFSSKQGYEINHTTLMEIIGRSIQVFIALALFGSMAYMIASTKDQGGFFKKIHFLTKPSPDWGPLLPQNKYIMEIGEKDRIIELEKSKHRKSSIIKDFRKLRY